MYNNDENRPRDAWERPLMDSTYHYGYGGGPIDDEPPKPAKKKPTGLGGKAVALCLVCALAGGLVGGGAIYALGGGIRTTTLVEGVRPPTVVSMAQTNTQSPLSAAQIYKAYVGSTVGITTQVTTNVWGQTVTQAAAGSGFVISQDGYILTNYHVIKDASTIKVAFSDGTNYDATLIGGEEGNDIAVLKIEATGLTPVVIGDSAHIQVGEGVVAIGNPLGELTYTMTQGIVSAKDRSITMSEGTVMNMIQTDTAINSGNSGGPLFDMYGQVIGITSAKLSGNSGSEAAIEGLGFAIPVNDIKDMVTDIIEHGYVTGKPYLGITVKTIPENVAKEYNIAQGAQVQSVDETSCSAKSGMQVGDIITTLDGKQVLSAAELIETLKDYQSGQTVAVTVDRGGVLMNLDLVFDEDTPARRAAQDKALQEAQQAQQEQQQQQSNDFGWPFGNLNPWFY